MRTLIADDEPLARSRLKRLLAMHPEFTCVGEACNGNEALTLAQQVQPDLVLLDIEMPGIDGLVVAAQLNQMKIPPAIIFITAHPEHALDAYRAGPADYLVKPVDPERLAESLQRVGTPTRAHLDRQDTPSSSWINYKSGTQHLRIPIEQVQYFMAEDKYVRMVFDGGSALIDQSLKQLEQQFSEHLLRVHRQTLVNQARICGITLHNHQYRLQLTQTDEQLEVSRRLVGGVKRLIKAQK